jgi:hypothetical protein
MPADIRVREAFLSALLLTGAIDVADQAVSTAIATMGCDGSVDELLVATAKYAIQLRDKCLTEAEVPSSLPPELRRLFLLSSVGRDCFVLRILMGLTQAMSSKILNLDGDEFDEGLCRALSDLPGLAGIQSARVRTTERSLESGSAIGPRLIH